MDNTPRQLVDAVKRDQGNDALSWLAYHGYIDAARLYLLENPLVDVSRPLAYARKAGHQDMINFLYNSSIRLDILSRDPNLFREIARRDPTAFNVLNRVNRNFNQNLRDMNDEMRARFQIETTVHKINYGDPDDYFVSPRDSRYNVITREIKTLLANERNLRHGDFIYAEGSGLFYFWDNINKEVVNPAFVIDRPTVPKIFRVGYSFNPNYWRKAMINTRDRYADVFWPDLNIATDAYKRMVPYPGDNQLYYTKVNLSGKEYTLFAHTELVDLNNPDDYSWSTLNAYYEDYIDTFPAGDLLFVCYVSQN